jgi:hypothetical protein
MNLDRWPWPTLESHPPRTFQTPLPFSRWWDQSGPFSVDFNGMLWITLDPPDDPDPSLIDELVRADPSDLPSEYRRDFDALLDRWLDAHRDPDALAELRAIYRSQVNL